MISEAISASSEDSLQSLLSIAQCSLWLWLRLSSSPSSRSGVLDDRWKTGVVDLR